MFQLHSAWSERKAFPYGGDPVGTWPLGAWIDDVVLTGHDEARGDQADGGKDPPQANKGVMTIGALLNRIDLASPHLEYATGVGATTGRITFQDEYDAVGGDRVTIFGVSNMMVKDTKGRVAKAGAAWKRTDRHLITGDVSIVDDPQLVSALNAYIGTTFFTPGMAFGTLDSKVTTTITCTTRRECA